MPISASRTSDRLFSCGFTLLELLVVVTLVAILTGTVILGFTGADQEQRLRGAAEQLAQRMELARQYALQRNREWGVYVDADSVRFAEFDPEQDTWVEQARRPFATLELPANVRLEAESEGLDQLPESERDRLPKVILFSSGEVTPFTISLMPDWESSPWQLSSDGLSKIDVQRKEG